MSKKDAVVLASRALALLLALWALASLLLLDGCTKAGQTWRSFFCLRRYRKHGSKIVSNPVDQRIR
jgi:hypothetical protein